MQQLFPPSGWKTYTLGGSSEGWKRNTSYPYSGSGCLYHQWQIENVDDWFVSPPINVNSYYLVLSFYEINSYMSYYGYSGVWISSSSGDPANGTFVELYESKNPLTKYTKKDIILSGYKGKTIYIAFRYKGYNAHGWYIDEIKLEEPTSFFNDLSLNSTNFNFNDYFIGAPQYAKLVVENKGLIPIPDTTKIKFYVNNILKETKEIGKVLLPGKIDTINFLWGENHGYCDIKFIKASPDDTIRNDTLKSSCFIVNKNSIIQDFEYMNSMPFGYIYNKSSSLSSLYKYKNSYSLSIETSKNDTLFLNKYLISNDSYLAFFSYNVFINYKISLLYSIDGIQWTEHSSKSISGGKFSFIDFSLSSFAGKEIYLALKFSSLSIFYIDYMLLPQPVNVSVSPDLFKLVGDEYNYRVDWVNFNLKETKVSDATINKVYFYFGTDGNGVNTPTNIVSGREMFSRSIGLLNLDYNKTYYLQVIPENYYGLKQYNTPIWVIKTPPRPCFKPDYIENFDSSNYIIPLGWDNFEMILKDSVKIVSGINYKWKIKSFLNNFNKTLSLNYNINWLCNNWIVSPHILLEDTIHKYYITFDFGLTKFASNVADTMAKDDSVGIFITKDSYLRRNDTLLWITSKDKINLSKHYKVNIPTKYYNDTIRIGFYAYSGKSNTDIDIFIDNFSVRKISENCLLDSVKLDGKVLSDFSPNKFLYILGIDENTNIPIITAVPQDSKSVVEVIQAQKINDTAKIIVTAENPNFKSIYCIVFKTLSKNAFLSDLKLNNQTIDGFDPQKQKYTVEFNQWDNIPFVTAIAQDSCARVEITQPSKLPDTVVVKVIAEDTSVINYYYVLLLVKTGIENSITNNLRVYPNPAKNYIYVEGVEILGANLILMDLSGKVLFERRLINGRNLINIESLQKGVYLLKILNDSNVKVFRFIKE